MKQPKQSSLQVKSLTLSLISVFLFSLFLTEALLAENTQAQEIFKKASKLNTTKKYDASLKEYKNIINNFPTDVYAAESLFMIAVIYDEQLHNPPLASDYYNQYLKKYKNGRHSKRAEIRLTYLAKYKDADPVIYKSFIKLMNSGGKNKLSLIQQFIKKYPELKYLDDALLFVANEYKGPHRKILSSDHKEKVKKAIPYFNRIIKKFPKRKSALIAMKNLGDCYRMLGNSEKASYYYSRVIKEGGDYGISLVGDHGMLADMQSSRKVTVSILSIASLLLIAFLAFYLPVKEFSSAGFKQGLYHSLFFLPVAIIFTVVSFLIVDPIYENMTGREPYAITLLMITMLLAVVFNGFVLEANKRKKIDFRIYAISFVALLLAINYSVLYLFGLLQILEKYFV